MTKPRTPPAKPWPPPVDLLPYFAAGRDRWARLPAHHRPALDCPTAAMVLWTMGELKTIAAAGYWPLSERAKRWIREG